MEEIMVMAQTQHTERYNAKNREMNEIKSALATTAADKLNLQRANTLLLEKIKMLKMEKMNEPQKIVMSPEWEKKHANFNMVKVDEGSLNQLVKYANEERIFRFRSCED